MAVRCSTPVDMDTLRQLLRGEVTVRRPVVVTFDDGFASVFTAAYPILRSLDIPFCVFQTTAFVGAARPKPMLTWEQLETMHRSGLMTVGAHTHTHRPLRDTDCETPDWELDQCATELRKRLDVDVPYFGVSPVDTTPRPSRGQCDILPRVRSIRAPAPATPAGSPPRENHGSQTVLATPAPGVVLVDLLDREAVPQPLAAVPEGEAAGRLPDRRPEPVTRTILSPGR